MKPDALYGVLAEFRTAGELLEAARAATGAGYRDVEAYTPFPVEGLDEALAMAPNRVPLAALLGGVAGGVATYFLQWYTAVIDYPIDVGGRPLHSWPAFVPATFEITILGAALAAVAAMLVMNGLPRLNHPLFAVPEFDLATRNRFFLCVRARGARFDADKAHALFASLAPLRLCDVPA